MASFRDLLAQAKSEIREVDTQGADESRISVEAFGSDRPEFKPGASAKNRRVVIVAK